MRATISKGASSNTASLNFQDNFSTRVQFGLLGNDDFTVSTSPDGSAFSSAIVANRATGAVSFPNTGGFTGDSGAGGSSGLVPAPAAGTAAAGKYLRADGTWAVPPGSGGSDMTGASSGAAGTHGLVPAPIAGYQNRFLRGNATWAPLAASATTDTTNASNITSGTLPAAQLPAPLSSALGGVKSISAVSHKYLTSIGSDGGPAAAQPSSADLSDATAAGIAMLTAANAAAQTALQNNFAGDSGSGGTAGHVPAPAAGTGKFLKADGTWSVPGGGSGMIGATSGAAGSSGLVPAPSAGQQNLFLRGDATFADPGSVLTHFSFRDPSVSGFTGAKYDMAQVAGQSNATDTSAVAYTISVASGEIVLLRVDYLMALSDFSKCNAGSVARGVKNVSGTISQVSTSGTYTNDAARDHTGTDTVGFTNSGGNVVIYVQSDSSANTYNYFMNIRILRMKTSS